MAATSTSSAGVPVHSPVSRIRISHSSRPVRILGREHRRRVVRDAVDREVEDQVVVVRLLERRQAGQDHVGVPGGLVEPVVDG